MKIARVLVLVLVPGVGACGNSDLATAIGKFDEAITKQAVAVGTEFDLAETLSREMVFSELSGARQGLALSTGCTSAVDSLSTAGNDGAISASTLASCKIVVATQSSDGNAQIEDLERPFVDVEIVRLVKEMSTFTNLLAKLADDDLEQASIEKLKGEFDGLSAQAVKFAIAAGGENKDGNLDTISGAVSNIAFEVTAGLLRQQRDKALIALVIASDGTFQAAFSKLSKAYVRMRSIKMRSALVTIQSLQSDLQKAINDGASRSEIRQKQETFFDAFIAFQNKLEQENPYTLLSAAHQKLVTAAKSPADTRDFAESIVAFLEASASIAESFGQLRDISKPEQTNE